MKKAHLNKWRQEEPHEYRVLENGCLDLSMKSEKYPRSNGYNYVLNHIESGTDHTSEIDLSKNGSLDYPRSSFTELKRPLDFNRGHAHHHPQTGALDLRAGNVIGTSSLNGVSDSSKNTGSHNLNGVNKSTYMHYSGGFAEDLRKNRSVVEGLLDLSTSGTAFQMPRIKLQPGLGIDPTITYKPEVDCNHNEAVKVENVNVPMETYTTLSDAVVTIPKVCQGEGQSDDMTYMSSEYDSSSTEPAVHVEEMEHCNSSQIPLTVTSPDDDDNDSGTESVDSKSSDKSLDKSHKKRPGRKKGQVSKVYHLWEFIRDVLADPRYCPTVIKWENQEEGIFRVVQSETAAAMWGNKKNNRTKMTYEKMSRSIRYSRKEGYFADIPRDKGYPKKLCFKFGHKAHGWNSKIKQ